MEHNEIQFTISLGSTLPLSNRLVSTGRNKLSFNDKRCLMVPEIYIICHFEGVFLLFCFFFFIVLSNCATKCIQELLSIPYLDIQVIDFLVISGSGLLCSLNHEKVKS